MIALAMLGVLAYAVMPTNNGRALRAERQKFSSVLNGLAREGWVRALTDGHCYRLMFRFPERTVRLEKMEKDVLTGDARYTDVFVDREFSKYQWPDYFEFRNFFLEKVDEMAERKAGETTDTVFGFILPEGIAQEIVLNILDTKDSLSSPDGRELCVVLNPFSVQFEAYEKFQYPVR